MAKHYIDACIWRDYLEDWKDKWRPLGEWANRLFNKIISENSEVIISDMLAKELNLSPEDLKASTFLNLIPLSLIRFVRASKKQDDTARKIAYSCCIPKPDALHAIIALENDAVLVTRDKHFFGLQLSNLVVKKPEELV